MPRRKKKKRLVPSLEEAPPDPHVKEAPPVLHIEEASKIRKRPVLLEAQSPILLDADDDQDLSQESNQTRYTDVLANARLEERPVFNERPYLEDAGTGYEELEDDDNHAQAVGPDASPLFSDSNTDDETDQPRLLNLSDLDDEPALAYGPGNDSDDSSDRSVHEELRLDSEDDDYDAGLVDSEDEDDDENEAAEAIAASLLDDLGDDELEDHRDIDYMNPYQPISKQALEIIGTIQYQRDLAWKIGRAHV